MVCHWESLVAEQVEGGSSNDDDVEQPTGKEIRERDDGVRRAEEGHARLKAKAEFFYTDNRMVASTSLGWLQTAFDTMTGIFRQMGLRTNVRKTVGMVCQPCRADGVRADEAYTRRMEGEG